MSTTNPSKSRLIKAPIAPEDKSALSGSPVRPRLGALTTLRFFAALHVVLFHMRVVRILDGGPWWYQNFASIGYVGVNLFFVLSGFILVYTYAGPPLNTPRFWQARFARIYPAYVLSLIVSAPFFFFAVRHLDLPFFAWSKQHLSVACILTVGLLQAWVPQAALLLFCFPAGVAVVEETVKSEACSLDHRLLARQPLFLFGLRHFTSRWTAKDQLSGNQSLLEERSEL
jgi:hypothetical protein